MILNCVIIDDEPLALDLLESYVSKTPFLNLVGRYSSAVAAMKEISNKKVDLLFLDIQMPELDGLEFAKMVSEETRIVFTTAFSQYAVDGYRVNALDYLLKPFGYKDFLEAANKALEWFRLKNIQSIPAPTTLSSTTDDCIYVKSDYKLIQIQLSDILYIEGLKDYVKIYTEGQSRPILSLCSMKTMEERLPADRFLRVHRSYIVCKQKVRVIDRGRIVFGQVFIPVSESYKAEWMAFLNERAL